MPHANSSDVFILSLTRNGWFIGLTTVLWAAIAVEGIAGACRAPDRRGALVRLLLVSLVPALRMAFVPRLPNRWVWIPCMGWREVGRAGSDELEIRLAPPMLVITLLIVPVLLAETFIKLEGAAGDRLALALHLATALIWVAFVVEFILMVGLAPDKIAYCKQYWVNLVIIVLPVVAFLRILYAARFLRLFRAGQLMRAYRLRGLYTRALRLVMVFNLLDRLAQRNPARYLRALDAQIARKEEELATLRARAARCRGRLGPGRDGSGSDA